MRTSLYMSSDALMRMESDGDLTLAGDTFTLKDDDRTFDMQPAVRFVSVLSGEDADGFVGQVLAVSEVVKRGGEHYRDSVLVGDVAYQVEEGFLGPPPAPPEASARHEKSDTGELLRKGLLDGLST